MPNTVLNQYTSPNSTPNSQVSAVFGMPRSLDFITIHWWGDPNQGPSFEGVIGWLCNPRSAVSAHDVVTGTGRRVAVIVDYPNAAWHSGNARGNATSLGFELDPRCRQEDYEAAAEDIADTWKYYGRIIPLRGHNTWTATTCPGNYDLNRLHNMALKLYNGEPGKVTATADQVKQAYRDILEREADAGGLQTYTNNGMSNEEVRADLFASNERKLLEQRKAEDAARQEWVRNLVDIDDTKLYVLPAEGAKVINLQTMQSVNDNIIPRKTAVDVAKKTTVKSQGYYLSSYAVTKGLPWGIPVASLGELAVDPPQEKPEWQKNLKDIEDKDMWTRSETPVLNIENGDVLRRVAINTKVRITHSTQIVGKDLLVLEGGKEVIEPLYLSDNEIKNPYDDLEKRVKTLEDYIKQIVEFFKNLGKK